MSEEKSSDLVLIDTNAQALTNPRLDELARSLVEFKLNANDVQTQQEQKLQKLQRQIWWLRGGLLLTLLAGLGSGIWLGFNQRSLQLAQQSLQANPAVSGEPLVRLDSQVSELKTQVNQAKDTNRALNQRLDKVVGDLQQRQKAIGILAKSLQELVTEAPEAALPSPEQPETSKAQEAAKPKPSPSVNEPSPSPSPTVP